MSDDREREHCRYHARHWVELRGLQWRGEHSEHCVDTLAKMLEELRAAAAAEARDRALREADEAVYELAGEYAASTGTVGRAHVRALSKAADAIRALRGGGR